MAFQIQALPAGAGPARDPNVRIRDVIGRRIGRPYPDGIDAVPDAPQAYVVEQLLAHSELRAHFHVVDQFQVFIEGNGMLGKKSVGPVTVQFAGAFTPYGPIVAGETSLGYYTIRAKSADPGSMFMPESRNLRKPVKPRQYVAAVDAAHPSPQVLFGPFDDGLNAECIVLGAGTPLALKAPAHSSGAFALVINGELDYDGATYGQWACAWVCAGEATSRLRAASRGADVLMLTFPTALEG